MTAHPSKNITINIGQDLKYGVMVPFEIATKDQVGKEKQRLAMAPKAQRDTCWTAGQPRSRGQVQQSHVPHYIPYPQQLHGVEQRPTETTADGRA